MPGADAAAAAAAVTPREEICLRGRSADNVVIVLLHLRAAAICGDDAGSIAARGRTTARRVEEKAGCNRGDAIELDDDVAADAADGPPPLLLSDAAAADAIARRASRDDVAKEHRRKSAETRERRLAAATFFLFLKGKNKRE